MKFLSLSLILASLVFCFSCKTGPEKQKPLFELLNNTGINFINKAVDGKEENSFQFRNFYNGGGVAIGDINNDNLPDVFLTSNTGANKLYLNKGNLHFEDISDKAGIIVDDKWNTGVTFADVNADGWLDIYVCSSGHMTSGSRKNKLYINNHNLGFVESADKVGLGISAYSTQVSFFDYDLDGDLDCFMINNSPIPINQLNFANRRDIPDSAWRINSNLRGGGDHLFRNDNGYFNEVTKEAGIHGGLISFGLGVSIGDINNDGYPDVFVSNDSYEKDYLYMNQQNGTFRDELENWMQHTSFSSMGADISDINNDGYVDLFTTDMLGMDDHRLKTTGIFDNISLFNSKLQAGFYFQYTKNCLQLNNKNGKFIDIARYSGVAASDWSWGALMFDINNDGWNDLLVCNGITRDVTNLDFIDFFANEMIQRSGTPSKPDNIEKLLQQLPQTPLANKIYRNDRNLKFTDIGADWGMNQLTFSNGAAYGDLDNDGDLDLVINNLNQPSSVFKNNSRELSGNNYISLTLKGKGQNPFAIGSKVRLFVNGEIHSRELIPSRGFQSSVDYKLVFGLDTTKRVDSMVISWPDRTQQTFILPAINRTHVITQEGAVPATTSIGTEQELPYFSEVNSNFEKHREDDHIDFNIERGIPRILSREGPRVASGDINSDGLVDLFIGGTSIHPGQLYIQSGSGRFYPKPEQALLSVSGVEDGATLFVDVEQDGDLDLLLCPGGNNRPPQAKELQMRLFINDGRGNFTEQPGAFPLTGINVSVAIDNDFNQDGYPDLFIGGRNFPGEYGKEPRSFLFINDKKGNFSDVTFSLNPQVAVIGMVTGAVWADVSGDGARELIITGEWMAPRIFSFKNDRCVEIKTNLGDMYGWWQSIAAADLDGDGRQDLVLGNTGENFYFHPAPETPVKLWIDDFDKNDHANKIITHTVQGRDLPVMLKNDMQEQLPSIKSKNLKHREYAEKSIQELFQANILSKTVTHVFNYPSSCVAINKGNGTFQVNKLPVMSQLSCINVIRPTDVNQDGAIDLVTGGNQFGFLPQFEKLDASLGDVLINNGKGQFTWQEARATGLELRGEVKDITEFQVRESRYFLFLQNNEFPVLYRLNPHEIRTQANRLIKRPGLRSRL